VQAVIDLTERQLRRVLEQALRSHSPIELEPRTRKDCVLQGEFIERTEDGFRIRLADDSPTLELYELIGAYIDARLVMSGQLYMFSTCVIEADLQSEDSDLVLAEPYAMHVANRRRYERRTLAEFAQVQIWLSDSQTPFYGELCNVSGEGLACRMIRGALDEALLIGDTVRVGFELPGPGESFTLPGALCTKALSKDGNQLIVGIEFDAQPADPVTRLALDRLRAVLCRLTTGLAQKDGES
jgi:hypothetical protein